MRDRVCDLNEHLSCSFYSDNNPNPLIETIELFEGEILRRESDKHEAVLLLSGSILLSREGFPDENIAPRNLFLLHPGDIVRLRGVNSAYLVVCGLNEDVKYCHKLEDFDFQGLESQNNASFFVLPFKEPILRFTEGLVACIEGGLKCEVYLTSKFTELMILLRAYYTKPEIAGFFQPVMRKLTDFQSKIFSIEGDVKTVKEMAMKCHITEVGLRKKFQREMGMSPKEYLMERKKRLISKDLRNGVKNNYELCEEYGFTSPSSFNNFCRTYLGGTPSDLRKA